MKKILVIDDEKNIQASLTNILTDEGYKVFTASSGEDGLEKCRNIHPEAVFLDIWLPGIDGLETMKNILRDDPAQIIIMISGHGNISTAVNAVKNGAYDFLEKPLTIDKVIFVLKRALQFKKVLKENRKLKSIISQTREESREKSHRDSTGVMDFNLSDTEHFRKQRTVRKNNIYYGRGLHSGEKTGMSIVALPPGKGIRFANISEKSHIPARVEYLDDTNYATSLKKDNLQAKTIEHLMATLHAFGITNLLIKINREVPIGDGSATHFCDFIRESGIQEQNDLISEIIIREPHIIGEEGKNRQFIKILPSDTFSVKYTAIYPPPLGTVTYDFTMDSSGSFAREVAPARTYGFVEESIKLARLGLAEGGRMNNFILFDNSYRVINTKLRFPEEVARHKILDIIGDMYLLGHPVRGRIIAQKTGHSENSMLVNLIKERYLG